MTGLARQAAQSMPESKAADSHARADKLREEMERLLEDAGQPGQQGLAMGLVRALRLQRGMNPGDSFRQMMLSNKFCGLPDEGGSAAGMGGLMAMGAMDGNPMLLGGESLMDGPIADAIAGRGDGGGQGNPGAPTARIDRPHQSNVNQSFARRTSTPDSGTLQTKPFLTAEWRWLAMLNYEVSPEILKPWLPHGVELDYWQGGTLVSLVGFRFLDTRVLGMAIPGHRDFDEVNLRFNVGKPIQWLWPQVLRREG